MKQNWLSGCWSSDVIAMVPAAAAVSLWTFSCVPGFSVANTSSTNLILAFSNGIRSLLNTTKIRMAHGRGHTFRQGPHNGPLYRVPAPINFCRDESQYLFCWSTFLLCLKPSRDDSQCLFCWVKHWCTVLTVVEMIVDICFALFSVQIWD